MSTCAAQKWSGQGSNALAEMKKELVIAQKKLQKQQTYVEQLEEEIAHLEIAIIQKELAQVNKEESSLLTLSHEQWLALFGQQREILGQIIRNNPACREEAQKVLDQILCLITLISDSVE